MPFQDGLEEMIESTIDCVENFENDSTNVEYARQVRVALDSLLHGFYIVTRPRSKFLNKYAPWVYLNHNKIKNALDALRRNPNEKTEDEITHIAFQIQDALKYLPNQMRIKRYGPFAVHKLKYNLDKLKAACIAFYDNIYNMARLENEITGPITEVESSPGPIIDKVGVVLERKINQ